jgi:hypothetical protein
MYSSVNSHFDWKSSDEKKKKKLNENNTNSVCDDKYDKNINKEYFEVEKDDYNGIRNYISSQKIDDLNEHIEMKKNKEFLTKNEIENISPPRGHRRAINVDGVHYLPSNMNGFYNREKRMLKNCDDDKYIDFQIILSEDDFMILEKRKSAQNRVLQYNEFISPIKFTSAGKH